MDTPPRARGRPRAFDTGQALHAAMLLFWRHGYDGVSVAQLATAMGIAPASLYVAFGSKEALYRAALQLYVSTLGRLGVEALQGTPTAREGVRAVLRAAAAAFTRRDLPPGCMVGIGSLRCAAENRAAEEAAAELRRLTARAVCGRIERARNEGELRQEVSAQALTDFYGAVVEGMSVRARDGASRERLLRMVDTAMTAWPGGDAAGRPAAAACTRSRSSSTTSIRRRRR